jgi:hypothetical protein
MFAGVRRGNPAGDWKSLQVNGLSEAFQVVQPTIRRTEHVNVEGRRVVDSHINCVRIDARHPLTVLADDRIAGGIRRAECVASIG